MRWEKVTDMLKDLAEAMYYRTLTNIMEESDVEDVQEMLDRRFYDDYRYKTTGRYAPKGKGSYVGRRGYEEPPYMHMMNMEDLQDWDSMSEREGVCVTLTGHQRTYVLYRDRTHA